jgi:hypothetical protein
LPKRDPLNTWFDTLPSATKRKIELMLKHQEVAFLLGFLADLKSDRDSSLAFQSA